MKEQEQGTLPEFAMVGSRPRVAEIDIADLNLSKIHRAVFNGHSKSKH